VQVLLGVLSSQTYEVEAKLFAIVALGDLCLTAERQHF
jgi:hypothetical protein